MVVVKVIGDVQGLGRARRRGWERRPKVFDGKWKILEGVEGVLPQTGPGGD